MQGSTGTKLPETVDMVAEPWAVAVFRPDFEYRTEGRQTTWEPSEYLMTGQARITGRIVCRKNQTNPVIASLSLKEFQMYLRPQVNFGNRAVLM